MIVSSDTGLLINCVYITNPEWAVDIVETACLSKFDLRSAPERAS